MIYDVENETLPREDLEELQLKRLQRMVEQAYSNVPFYRSRFDELGLRPEHIRSLSDIKYLPLTEKQDLRNNYPFGMFAVPKENVVRIHASSGTTGKATVVGYTRRDIRNWAELMARSYMAAGVSRRDTIHNAYGYGLFTGGLGVHYGAEQMGATILPVSGGGTKRQVMLLNDFKPSVLCCTPSFALHLYDVAQSSGINFRDLALHCGIFGAEPWTEEMRAEIESKLGLTALDIYGLSEIMGPWVAMECNTAQQGLHIWEDHFLAEIIDPETREPLPPGEQGELVITTLTKEALPLVRYRTKDLTRLTATPCRCGRTHMRMDKVQGRTDDMLIIRGVNVFP
ncbi:MAG: phenylacetate--CoA ligase, partial [Desulfohalobiaceae bacterium]